MSTLTLAERQPVAVIAAVGVVVTAALHLLVVFQVPIDEEQTKAISATVDAVGLLVIVVLAMRAVTPNAKVITRVTTDGNVVAGDAAVAPTGTPVPVAGPAAGDQGAPPVVRPVEVNPDLIAG